MEESRERSKTRVPEDGTVFKEGYLRKRAMKSGRNWRRRFFILEGTSLRYYTNARDLRERGGIDINEDTTVEDTDQFKDRALCLAVNNMSDPVLYLAMDEAEEMEEWKYVLECAVKYAKGEPCDPPQVKARFFEGELYKTPTDPRLWTLRHFELVDGLMTYYTAPGKGKKGVINLKGAIVEVGQTTARGSPTPFVFEIRAQEAELRTVRVYNLAAQNEDEYLEWLKAIQSWIEVLECRSLKIEEKREE